MMFIRGTWNNTKHWPMCKWQSISSSFQRNVILIGINASYTQWPLIYLTSPCASQFFLILEYQIAWTECLLKQSIIFSNFMYTYCTTPTSSNFSFHVYGQKTSSSVDLPEKGQFKFLLRGKHGWLFIFSYEIIHYLVI